MIVEEDIEWYMDVLEDNSRAQNLILPAVS